MTHCPHCGCDLPTTGAMGGDQRTRSNHSSRLFSRSDEEHNLLFGVIALAFHNWPERHRFRPDDAEHLRAWLAIEAKHCEILDVPGNVPVESMVAIGKFFCGGKRHFRVGMRGDAVCILRPLTMNKRDIGAKAFRSMAAEIYAIIEEATGITPEIYKQNKDKVA